MGTSVVFDFWLLEIKLLYTFRYMVLYERMLSLLWDKYLDTDWLGHVVSITLKKNCSVSIANNGNIPPCYWDDKKKSKDKPKIEKCV